MQLAGMLICTEAGGTVSDLNGNAINFPDEVTIGRCMVATNAKLHHKVIEYPEVAGHENHTRIQD